MVNVRDFQYVAEIARWGSISKAAEALYITQPTLTKFLQRVEGEVGTPLFYRVGKRFLPTPAGELYIARAESILRLSQQLEQELRDLSALRSGSIRMGATAGRVDYIVTAVLPQFCRRYPGVRVLLGMHHTQQMMQMILNNELDILVANHDEEQPALEYEYLGEDELALAVPAGSPLAGAARQVEGFRYPVISPEDWREEPFVLPSIGSRSRSLAESYFQSVGVRPRVVAELMGIQAVMSAVQAGVGVSIFTSVPYPSARELRYLSLGRRDIPRQRAAVITRRGIRRNEAQEYLIELLRRAYQ